MNAKEMFKQLGYEFEKEYTRYGVNDTYRYNKCSRPTDSVIFYLDGKQIIINQTFHTIHLNELQAIIQQCKELGWLESESKQETNLDHYKDDIAELFIDNLAIVDGKPKRCVYTVCDERCDLHTDCDDETHYKPVKEWIKKPYQKPTFKLTQFEYDLLQLYKGKYSFKLSNSLRGMKEKGYFRSVDENAKIEDILESCEVIK